MDFSFLKQKRNREHPTREFFRSNRIPLRVVSEYIDRHYNNTSAILSGRMNVTPEVDEKLFELRAMIEKELKKNRKEEIEETKNAYRPVDIPF